MGHPSFGITCGDLHIKMRLGSVCGTSMLQISWDGGVIVAVL